MKTWILLPLLFLSIPAHAAKWDCSGVAKFTDPETGDTAYSKLRIHIEPKDSGTFSATLYFGPNPPATGLIFMESPTRLEASGPIMTGGTRNIEGIIDFQIQGGALFGDVTLTVTSLAENGGLLSKAEGRTFQECLPAQ